MLIRSPLVPTVFLHKTGFEHAKASLIVLGRVKNEEIMRPNDFE